MDRAYIYYIILYVECVCERTGTALYMYNISLRELYLGRYYCLKGVRMYFRCRKIKNNNPRVMYIILYYKMCWRYTAAAGRYEVYIIIM